MMTPEDCAALDAITQLYSRGAHRIAATKLVQHDTFTGRAYVHVSPIMAAGLQVQGYDPSVYERHYAANLQRAGLWPADRAPMVLLRRTRRWSRRGWRVVIGRG